MRLANFFAFLAIAVSENVDRSALKVLVYNPKFGHSHSAFMGNLADILADEGFNVTSLIPVIRSVAPDGSTKGHVVYVPGDPWAVDFMTRQHGDMSESFGDGGWDASNILWQLPMIRDPFSHQCEYLLTEHTNIIELLKQDRYDVFIAENFDMCGTGLSHLIGAKSFIPVSSTNLFDNQAYQIGLPLLSAIIPGSFGRAIRDGSLFDRLNNLIALGTSLYMWRSMESDTEAAFKRVHGHAFPDFDEIMAKSAFVLVNSDPFVDFARPTMRKIVEIGGIGIKDVKPLTEEWEQLLALRPRTVVFSLGSCVRSSLMPKTMKEALLKAFARFPDTTFLWKYEEPEDKLAKFIPNVILRKWIPQNDLLATGRVNGLIVHGGKASTMEAATRGVPSIFIPMYGDQFRNSAAAAHAGFGHVLNKDYLRDVEKIEAALHHILDDEQTKKRTADTKRMIESRPFTPKELLVRHVEFAARNGPIEALHAEGLHLSYLVYYNIDILIAAIAISSLVVFVIYRVVRAVVSRSVKIKQE